MTTISGKNRKRVATLKGQRRGRRHRSDEYVRFHKNE